jgi:hypothetical protein
MVVIEKGSYLGAAIALPVAYYEYYVVSDFEMNVLKKN